MTKLFPKITAIFFGIVFLLGGASMASAADVWSYTYSEPNRPTQFAQFSTQAECQAARDASTMFNKTPCTTNTSSESIASAEQQQAVAQAANAVPNTAEGGGFEQANNIFKQISCTGFMDCIMYLPLSLSYVLYILTAGVLTLSGYLFDATLTLSIDKSFILKPFVDTTWVVIRDFSNMAFIFVLLFAGIQTILGIGGWQKTIRNVIIIALLINFSLFFTKVVIDAGNVLAVGVYNSIGVVKTDKAHTASVTNGVKERDISSVLVTAFGPQTFLSAPAKTKSASLGVAIFVIGAVVNILVAFAFFRVALLFTGRIIGFWFLMIISPFAFISMTFPKGNVFDEWLKNLLGLSFVAPVFLFFLYLIMKVLAEGRLFETLVSPASGGGAFSFDVFFVPVVMVIFIYIALEKAVSFSKSMAGGFGDIGSKITSTALGLAAGGAGFAAQKTIGRAAMYAVGTDKFKTLAAKSPLGRVAYSLTDKTAGATFDVRNAPMGDKLGLGKGGSGSFVKTVEKAKKEDIAFGKKIATDKDGKPIVVGKDAEGKDITASQAYAGQLGKGYFTRNLTGGNIGAEQASKEIGKKEEKRKKLAKKEKDTIDNYKRELGIKEKLDDGKDNPEYKLDLDHPDIEAKKEEVLKELELKVAQTEADLEYLKAKDPGDTSTIAMAIVSKKKAEKALKKFENTKSEIEKIQQEIKKLSEDKEEKKKEDKKEEKEEKH